jgi:DNA-binding LytR/AlgR family response regulator
MILVMMETIKCLIVDDEPVARDVLKRHLAKIDSVEVVGSCKNAIEAFSHINKHRIDLIFLDIKMPEISGLSFAKSINKNIKVIFTTAYREYAVDGFDLQAVDYLVKPISFERLLQSIQKFLNENVNMQVLPTEDIVVEKQDFIFVRSDRKMVKINFNEILFVESLSDYVKIHLEENTVVTRETISSIEAKLPQNNFMRVHRSFIVSLAGIESFTSEHIEIKDHVIPISRGYKIEVLQRLEGSKLS